MLIGTVVLDEHFISQLMEDIKQKKELREINHEFMREQLFEYLKTDAKAVRFLQQKPNWKAAYYKIIIKRVRERLRRFHGVYRAASQSRQRNDLLEQLVNAPLAKSLPLINEILVTHPSTQERLSFYPRLYHQLFHSTGKPASIIDVGCGLNPFSIPLMNLKKLRYYAFDISNEEIGLLQKLFRYLHQQNRQFHGTAAILDALHWAKLAGIKSADLCFLFKMTDMLDQGRGHKATEMAISAVPAKHVVVSFPTKTLSGRKMNFPRRKWIELMCRRLGYSYTLLRFENELFYVVKKGS